MRLSWKIIWLVVHRRLAESWLWRLIPDEKGVIRKRSLVRYLPSDPVIVEAGAYTGADTVELAKIWPAGRIFAFEPLPSLMARVKARTAKHTNIVPCELALSDRRGEAMMHISGGASDASSSLRPPKVTKQTHPHITWDQSITVQTATLDQWAQEKQIDHVDFLWLDMQGHELAALKAAPRIMATVKVIVTEVFLKELYEGAPLYAEVRAWLEGQGFEVVSEKIAWEDSGNVLFVRR